MKILYICQGNELSENSVLIGLKNIKECEVHSIFRLYKNLKLNKFDILLNNLLF